MSDEDYIRGTTNKHFCNFRLIYSKLLGKELTIVRTEQMANCTYITVEKQFCRIACSHTKLLIPDDLHGNCQQCHWTENWILGFCVDKLVCALWGTVLWKFKQYWICKGALLSITRDDKHIANRKRSCDKERGSSSWIFNFLQFHTLVHLFS